MYLQEWPFPNDGKPRTLEEVSRVDARLRPMFSTSLANQSSAPHIFVIGAPHQVNIAPAFSRLVSSSARNSLFMFVEEDFVIDADVVSEKMVRQRMAEAARQLESADVVRLRSKVRPGDPDCARMNWRGREKDVLTVRSGDVARHKVLDSTQWLDSPHEYFPREMVWECAPQPARDRSGSAGSERWWCAFSTNAGWTNNPIMAEREWLLREIVPISDIEWTRRIESAVNLSPPLWDHACFIVAAGEGIFTHRDQDRPLEVQSPCARAREEPLL